jgi:uncharacterized protein
MHNPFLRDLHKATVVKQLNNGYLSNRVLKINVGFLLSDGPGHHHDSVLDFPAVRVAEDLTVNYVRGPIRLSRTTEGILVQGKLDVGVDDECHRCLEAVTLNVTVEIEELFAYPPSASAEFSLHDDGILDLSPLMRAEVLLTAAQGVLCRPDCMGLCPECGTNWNIESCTCADEQIDPRFAALKDLLK